MDGRVGWHHLGTETCRILSLSASWFYFDNSCPPRTTHWDGVDILRDVLGKTPEGKRRSRSDLCEGRAKGGLCRIQECSTALSSFLASQGGVLQPVLHTCLKVPSLTGVSLPYYFCYLQAFTESTVWKALLQWKWDFRAQHWGLLSVTVIAARDLIGTFPWPWHLLNQVHQQNLQVIMCTLNLEKHCSRILICHFEDLTHSQ